MKNLYYILKNIFKVKNIIFTIIIIGFAWSLKYVYFYICGVPLPNIYEEPLHLYRLIYLLLIKGFSLILNKIWKKISKFIKTIAS